MAESPGSTLEFNLKGRAGFGAGCGEGGCWGKSSDGSGDQWSWWPMPTPCTITDLPALFLLKTEARVEQELGEIPREPLNPGQAAMGTMKRAPGLLLNSTPRLCWGLLQKGAGRKEQAWNAGSAAYCLGSSKASRLTSLNLSFFIPKVGIVITAFRVLCKGHCRSLMRSRVGHLTTRISGELGTHCLVSSGTWTLWEWYALSFGRRQ